jgi:hypothetical protein
MPFDRRAKATIAVVATALTGMLAPPAGADGAVPLGGGAGITVNGTACTLTTIGHDKSGQLVGFTAAHCGGPGSQVLAEGAESAGPVGTVSAANGDLDYAVIRFDPAKTTPTNNFAGFTINGTGADPDYRQDVCSLGAATGNVCNRIGTLPNSKPDRYMRALFQPGDDGAPVTANGQLIGLILGGFILPPAGFTLQPLPETRLILFSAALADANAKGGPGAGFTPI